MTQPFSSSPDASHCEQCRAPVAVDAKLCADCGAPQIETSSARGEELRNVQYILSEIAHWQTQGIVNDEQARTLRETYIPREEELRAQLASVKAAQTFYADSPSSISPVVANQSRATIDGTASGQAKAVSPFSPRAREASAPKRSPLETISDAYTLRLLLYTGAAMLIVGVVIWLRDALYLKLQEPVVQAALLAFGTCAATCAGWYATLRTRQRLTGRALTLIGSLLVPVNFWFLVRSGLINNNGRAWMVCALCALLYATTAGLLRAKLYVYFACAASVATIWAIIFRIEHEAFGLYALTLLIASLALLHCSRLFPPTEKSFDENSSPSRGSYELWGALFVHAALAGTVLCMLCYMPLRLWSNASIGSGFFRLRANDYDPGVAMLVFACSAYTMWFAGRYIYHKRRVLLYALSALALGWTEFLIMDATRVSHLTTLLLLSMTALGLCVAAHVTRDEVLAKGFHLASLPACTLLALVSCLVALLDNSANSWTHAATLFVLATTFALQSAPRFCKSLTQSVLACASMLMMAVLFALQTNTQWFAAFFATALFLPFQLSGKFAREQRKEWLEKFSFDAAGAILFIAFGATLLEATAHLQTGDALLFAPCVTALLISALSFAASTLRKESASANYFRVGLAAVIFSYSLGCLRAGYSPSGDLEIYTTPVAILLLVIAYLFLRREHVTEKRINDAGALLWTGSVLLCAPLCLRAFEARLIEGVPALSRDLVLLCAALALILFGATKRLRAPASVGGAALLAELLVLALTSVEWAQVPLKIYLVTTGALIVFVCWCLEFRREQLLLVRKRINESRLAARERFGEWR